MLACANELSIQTFPFTTTDCLGSYSETRARPYSLKIWSHIPFGPTTVTFDEYVPGVRISGRFHSVLPPAQGNPELESVTLDGEFHGPVTLGDPNR